MRPLHLPFGRFGRRRDGPFEKRKYQQTGNFVYVTLATADPRSYIKLTYPFVPFTGYNTGDRITLEKFVNGVSTAKAEMAVDKSMDGPINSVTELKISFRNPVISVSTKRDDAGSGNGPGCRGNQRRKSCGQRPMLELPAERTQCFEYRWNLAVE